MRNRNNAYVTSDSLRPLYHHGANTELRHALHLSAYAATSGQLRHRYCDECGGHHVSGFLMTVTRPTRVTFRRPSH
ncbi:hypothetical protein E2C01_087573 [Portunus trituberculatus]|uniref:Uncharacterized protein n=1 Tax=Portunus trituberculatus TaxID=210409 RepID=A0A5B7JDQ9_PORTR|nr:hypothetical protein [Portunus trituberculatus]